MGLLLIKVTYCRMVIALILLMILTNIPFFILETVRFWIPWGQINAINHMRYS